MLRFNSGITLHDMKTSENEYDHIVIGGGSSGCVAAARLVSEGKRRVLLLEAGHSYHHPLLNMPPGTFKLINGSKYMTYHQTVPQSHLSNRVHDIPQGNVLGGGSSVNAQCYIRGRPSDYDEWDSIVRGSNDGANWAWESVVNHFTRMENNNRLQNQLHGVDGPLLVSDPGHINEVSRWFVQTVQEKGEPFNHDFNGERQRGVGFYQFMNRNGKRSSAANAYIEPLANNPNLILQLHCKVHKINIQNGTARSVTYKDRAGEEKTAYSNSDIILSAGALMSPKLLMLSGIGPADHLSSHGINSILDLPGVGQNLIDHPEVPVISLADGSYGYYRQGNGWRMLKNGLQFLMFGSGPITTTGFEAGAFINPIEPNQPPSIQAFCVPAVYLDRDLLQIFDEDYGVTITTVLIKPKSRGTVELRSSNPNDMPLVSPHLLKDSDDMKIMIEGQRYFRDVLQSGQLGQRIKKIIAPEGPDLNDTAMTEHCKKFVKTNYHPSGTARMGAEDDPNAVLDSRLALRGIENLRVCDMSAVPNITAGNTNAAAMMLGDRCADFILDRH